MEKLKCEYIYNQYHNAIFRYALGLLHDVHLAEDIMQETFLRLLKSSLPIPEEKTQSWLYKVARNLCYDILRKKKKEIAEILHTTEHSIKKRYERAIHSLEKCERRF